ncbi:MAG TPA: signal peptidase I [Chloroflexota bacterium]|nr:signal peptidase I [Chloroflexota bacterium]
MSDSVVIGNAADDGQAFRGWFVGHFVPPQLGLRSTDAIEVKFGTHSYGETRLGWAVSNQATSLSLVVRGRIRLYFSTGAETLLAEPGDYALWQSGVAHRWRIEADDTVVLTVRWPSRPGDAAELSESG